MYIRDIQINVDRCPFWFCFFEEHNILKSHLNFSLFSRLNSCHMIGYFKEYIYPIPLKERDQKNYKILLIYTDRNLNMCGSGLSVKFSNRFMQNS